MSRDALDPTAMTVAQLAELLTKAAKQKVTAEAIEKDIASGSPTNGDGTIHIVNYTAWLVAQAD
jgi:transcriptional/translational regulatory protein YebC/TACO1